MKTLKKTKQEITSDIMKKYFILCLAVVMIVSIGCEQRTPTVETSVNENLYLDGTKATYNMFADNIYIGKVTYTFTHDEIDGQKVLKIKNESTTQYQDSAWGLTQNIESIGETAVRFEDWKPLTSSYELSWDGDVSGWHKTNSNYGNGMVSWTEETPAGSRSNDIKFIETFEGEEYLDGDEVVWHTPTIPYKPDFKKYFTYFTNKSGTPLQGMIWLGEEHDIMINNNVYHTYAAGIYANEYAQRLWYEKDTGRMIKYEQDQGYMSHPGAQRLEAGTLETPKMTLTLTLEKWESPTE